MAREFHYFGLEEVYQYAEHMGYSRESVEIEPVYALDDDTGEEFLEEYEVSFGHEYAEMWVWTFEDLSQPAVDYDHIFWED